MAVSDSRTLAPPFSFSGVLFPDPPLHLVEEEPEFFADLNLDQLVGSLLEGRERFRLAPFFYSPPQDLETIHYRQEVFGNLENSDLEAAVKAFCAGMQRTRELLASSDRIRFEIQRQSVYLSAVETYIEATQGLAGALGELAPDCRALRDLADHVRRYVDSPTFEAFSAEARQVRAQLRDVRYRLRILGGAVTVSLPREEDDFTADVEDTFARFRESAVKSYRSKLRSLPELNHVEAEIVLRVARLKPEPFTALSRFTSDHASFLDETLTAFDREIQFYLAYKDHMDRMRRGGLPVSLPEISGDDSTSSVTEGYDPVLAEKLLPSGQRVVCNDFRLESPERLMVVTGPNHGGKTTFARMVAIIHYLGSLGLPVPARRARLVSTDRVFTHFERGENLQDLTGKLEDDLVRVRDILSSATPRSLIVINEIFTSTSLEDAVALGTEIIKRLSQIGALCVCVTFLDELAQPADATVSMVGTVDPEDPARRTYLIVRRPPDGLAYAEAIAEKYGVTYQALKARLVR